MGGNQSTPQTTTIIEWDDWIQTGYLSGEEEGQRCSEETNRRYGCSGFPEMSGDTWNDTEGEWELVEVDGDTVLTIPLNSQMSIN